MKNVVLLKGGTRLPRNAQESRAGEWARGGCALGLGTNKELCCPWVLAEEAGLCLWKQVEILCPARLPRSPVLHGPGNAHPGLTSDPTSFSAPGSRAGNRDPPSTPGLASSPGLISLPAAGPLAGQQQQPASGLWTAPAPPLLPGAIGPSGPGAACSWPRCSSVERPCSPRTCARC